MGRLQVNLYYLCIKYAMSIERGQALRTVPLTEGGINYLHNQVMAFLMQSD
jgi:hypothetical protein